MKHAGPLRSLALVLALTTCAACGEISFPPAEAPLKLQGAPALAPTDPKAIALYAGRPREAYDCLALVASQSSFGDPLPGLRAQAAAVGADAIVELDTRALGNLTTASGVAVRWRR